VFETPLNPANPVRAGALAGLTVIDLSRVLGGPYCTQMLADHGAKVIKVEPPQGDETRTWGPPFRAEDGAASYFVGINRNKTGIAVNLSKPQGREILFRLLGNADVLVENFLRGTMERWGLGYEQVLRDRFPRLIYCRISGFGTDGPLGGLPGYDAMVQAMAGLMSLNGEEGGGPLRVGVPLVDLATGMNSCIGILMALLERARSGTGQLVDAALYDSAVALLHPYMANFLMSGKLPLRTGNHHQNITPYDLFRTKTKPVYVAIGNDRQFARLCAEIGRAELSIDPKYRTNPDRVANRASLQVEMDAALSQLDGVALSSKLLSLGVPCGPVMDVADVASHAHTRHREMLVESSDSDEYRGTGNPIKLSRTPPSVQSAPPVFGSDTREVLSGLGYHPEEIEQFAAEGIVFFAAKKDA
jgi:crotonobetainyl-CoA:carnitine CoA-transferase CaiB-like acyl-CoA transferase